MNFKIFLLFSILFISCYSSSDFKSEVNENDLLSNNLVESDTLVNLNFSKESNENEVIEELIDGTDVTSKVVGVQDGDTIELRIVCNDKKAKERIGKNLRIRFAHIDCPEKGKPFYRNAKEFTRELVAGKTVKIIHNAEFDRYGRLIGEILMDDGTCINKKIVENGLAIHFKKYSKSIEYAELEQKAISLKLGIWSE
jgi:micrococcal nuclease